MKHYFITISFLFMSLLFPFAAANAQEFTKQELWNNGTPNSNGNPKDTAQVFIYRANPENNTGRAIVICPGGGYSHLSMTNEGSDWAKYYQSQGITAVILKYRMPRGNSNVPLSDAEHAIKMVRQNAAEWGVKPDQVGIMGFSAGGHLASTVATHSQGAAKPDFQILFYPVISMKDDVTHKGSCTNLLGKEPTDEQRVEYCSELQVTDQTPRAFICLAYDDGAVLPANSLQYYTALYNHKVPAVIHVYPKGGHGFGFRETFKFHNEMLMELSAWLKSF